MADIITDLRDIFKEFLDGGDSEFDKGRYNSAVTQYFKAVAVLCDLKIYEKRAVLPKNHTDRFRLLKLNFPLAYKLISKIFDDYTDSYNIKLTRHEAEEMKKNVEEIKRILEDKNQGKSSDE